MIQILFLTFLYKVKATCNFQSFEQAQLVSDNFYGEKYYTRGNPYAFGVWTMYAPLRDNYYYNSSKSFYNQAGPENGYHILNFQSDGKIQTLFFLKPVIFNLNQPRPQQVILQWTTTSVQTYTFSYHPYFYEGYWVFTYFAFQYQRKYNFASYNIGEDNLFNFLVTTRTLQSQTTNAKLEYGGQGQYKISSFTYNLNIFPGRISIVTLMDSPQFWTSGNQKAAFLIYIQNCNIPTPCQQAQQITLLDSVFQDSNLTVRQFNVDITGLRFYIEFWIRRDPLVERFTVEHIFSYGAQFQSQAIYKQLLLSCKPYEKTMVFSHQIYSFYAIPTDYYQDQISITDPVLGIPNKDLSKWNYFRYEIYRYNVYELIVYSIYQQSDGGFYQFLLYADPYHFQYSNYQATVSIFTDIIDYSPGEMEAFQGVIANFRIKYCYMGDPDFDSNSNLNCHESCKTCTGPTQWDCKSCYYEQNRELQPDLHSCVCLLDYLDVAIICQQNTYVVAQSSLSIPLVRFQCNFGYFEAWKDSKFYGCISWQYLINIYIYSPNLNQQQIKCLNCLLQSQTWYQEPICNLNDITDGIYFNLQSDNEFDFYIINFDQMSVDLCVGCAYQDNTKYQCKNNLLNYNNNCIPCTQNCSKCENWNCTQCEIGYYLQDNTCLACSSNCINCEISQNEIACTGCLQRFILFHGNCLQCGANCENCEIRYINDNYYRKCLHCIWGTYISLDGESCYYNTVEYCRYPFQFSSQNLTIATILYDFIPEDVQYIKTGCSFCEAYSSVRVQQLVNNSNIDDQSFACNLIGQSEQIFGCAYTMIDSSNNMYCLMGTGNLQIVGYGLCTLNLPYCLYCIYYDEYIKHCLLCNDGYYGDYYTSFCRPCPAQCLSCYQTDSSKINKPSTLSVLIIGFYFSLQSYQLYTQDPNQNHVEMLCTKCIQGYTLYQGQCIKSCPSICKECKVTDNQYVCISCLQLSIYSHFQLQDGQCIPCPTNCKLCKLRSQQEKKNANPYFDNTEFDFFSNQCFQPFDKNLFYDQDLKQFVNCAECEKIINLEINVFCAGQQTDLFNIEFEQLFNINPENYLAAIETPDYYLYLNTQYVKYVNYRFIFQPNSYCVFDSNTYFSSSLQKNVYNLLSINLEIDGNNSTIIFNGNATIKNFASITIRNFTLKSGGFKIANIKEYKLTLEQITTTSDNLNRITRSAFSLSNVSSIVINDLTISDISNLDGALIIINNQNSSHTFNMNHVIIKDSDLQNLNMFQFNTNQLLLTATDVRISNTKLINSKLFDIGNRTTLQISLLTISEMTIINSNNFIDQANSAQMNQVQILNSQIHNTTLIAISYNFSLINSVFNNLQIYGNSTLLSTISDQDNQNLQLTNIEFVNIIYQDKSSIMVVQKLTDNMVTLYMTKIKLTNISINNKLAVSQQSIDRSIIYIEADFVQFENFTITRGIGYSEFTLINVKSFNFINSFIYLEDALYFKTLRTIDCTQSTTNLLFYGPFIYLLDIQDTVFTQVSVNNIILYNSIFIDVQFSSILKEPTLSFEECSFSKNIIHQTTTQSNVSLLYISSMASLLVTLKSNNYSSNLLNIEIENTSSQQGLLFMINAASTIISDCSFNSNIIINGSSSILVINSDTVIIQNSNFINNSIFQFSTIKHFLVWNFEGQVYQEDLEKLYPVISAGGNGNLEGRVVQILNSSIKNSHSKNGGAFLINMLENGTLLIQNSQFSGLSTQMNDISQGGCFYVSSYSSYLEVNIVSSTFKSIQSRQFGGILYLQTSTKSAIINLINSSFTNFFSLQGSLIYIEQSQQGSLNLTMKNCDVKNEELEFESFINVISNITSNELTMLLDFFSLIYFEGGVVEISNLTITEYPYLQLFYFLNSVTLTDIKIFNTIFARPILVFNKNQDPITILISKFELHNCSLLETTQSQAIIIPISQQQNLVSSCQTYVLPEALQSAGYLTSNSNFLTLSKLLLKQSVGSVIQFNKFQQEDKITIKKININVDCSKCQFGALGLEKINSPQINIQNLVISQSRCGINGCLYISSDSRRLLESAAKISKRSTIIVSNLLCSNNYAQFGGCLYIKNQQIQLLHSTMIENKAQLGGAVYIEGPNAILDAFELSLINNSALEGSGLYSSQPYLYSQNGISFYDNPGTTVTQPPSRLYLQLFSNLTLRPDITYQDQYHQVNKILGSDGKEVVLYLPTGVTLQNYRRFDMKYNTYSDQKQIMRLLAFTDYSQIVDLDGTYCTCSVVTSNGTKLNNLTNANVFYFHESSYIFDDLILYLPQNSSLQFWLQFWCNSIYIPIIESHQIIGYHQNYTLQIRVKPYECQLGEFHVGEQDYCHQCRVDTQQYSVTLNSTSCQVKNLQKMRDITAAQINLNQGYWRYKVTSPDIDFCLNKVENCIGGWNVGNGLCLEGNIGALCEQCDYYNVKGFGFYQRFQEFECQLCLQSGFSHLTKLILTIFIFACLFIYLNNLQQNRKQSIFQLLISKTYQFKFKEVTTGQSIKIILQYFQLISLAAELKPIYQEGVQTVIDLLGNPFQQLALFNICRLIGINVNIVYIELLQNFICLLVIAWIFITVFLFMLCSKRLKLSQATFINFAYHYYIFFQASFIRSNLKLISVRSLQGEFWIYQNVAYLYNTSTHLTLVFACVLPILIGLGIFIPLFLLVQLKEFQRKMKRKTFRDFGFWFTAQNEYHWESIKIISLICVQICIISIDGNIALRFLFAFFVMLIYQKLFTSKTVYFNNNLNKLESRLIVLSYNILVLTTFYSIIDIDAFKQIVEVFLYINFIFSWIFMSISLYEFNFLTFKSLIQRLVGSAIKSYPQFLEYDICFRYSRTSTENYQRRLQLLRKYLLTRSKIIIYQKKELKETTSV